MIQSLKVRWAVILAALLLGLIWIMPNFINVDKIWWPSTSRIIMGLDIQGGSHLVYRVDVDGAIRQDATRLAAGMPAEMKRENVSLKSVQMVDPLRGEMRIELNKPEDAKSVQNFIENFYGNTLNIIETTPEAVRVEYAELYVRDFKSKLVDQAIATIRNRIDEFGVSEPSITAQGTDRILVQLPGIEDSSTAKDLINRTARLDFMIVSTEVQPSDLEAMIQEAEKANNLNIGEMKYSQYIDTLNKALEGKLPANTVVYFEKPENAASLEVARIPYLLSQTEIVTGDRLTNAQVGMDQFGAPTVNFKFDAVGTRQFGDLTRKHVKQQMAIVLDKVVKSAPSINEPITQGSGQITLGRSRDGQQMQNEAKLIATALRAGSLPAALEQLEERTVGPSLGRDAIERGQIATIAAAVLVFIFMALYYKSFGLIADIALALNLMFTVAILSALGATLTLPGVAGLALTIGMAVDANVIIFERVREEYAKGSSLAMAIREGYDRAFSAIFDGNVTTLLVAAILMYYGTGPIRGFAVTLIAGLTVSMFTAIFVTRAIFDLLVVKWKWNLSIR